MEEKNQKSIEEWQQELKNKIANLKICKNITDMFDEEKKHNNISLDLLHTLCPKDIEKIDTAWTNKRPCDLLEIVKNGLFNELKDYLKVENDNKIEMWDTYINVNNHEIHCDPANYQQLIERAYGESYFSFNYRPDKTQNIPYAMERVKPEHISIQLCDNQHSSINIKLLEDDHLYIRLNNQPENVSDRLMEKEKEYFAFTKTLSLDEGEIYLNALLQKLKTFGEKINIQKIIKAMKHAQNVVENTRQRKKEVAKREPNEEDGESTDNFFQLQPDDTIICECCGFTLNYSHSDKGIH